MISWVMYFDIPKIVAVEEVLKEKVSLVFMSRWECCIGITPDVNNGIRIFLINLINSVLQSRQVFHELRLLTSSREINIDVDADLKPRFV